MVSSPACGSSSTSSTTSADEYAQFIGGNKSGRRCNRRVLISAGILIGSFLALDFLIYCIFCLVQSYRFSYDRASDVTLLDQVVVSPAAAALPLKGEIFCWALTSDKYHDTRAIAVNETWLRRCDHGVFFTNAPFKQEDNIPFRTVFAGIPDAYENLFYKSRYAFYYVSQLMKADFEWYVKADDDTYLIVENLRKYLRTLNSSEPYYLGYRLKMYLDRGYNGGGAGYVLSKKALELFVQHAYHNATGCPDDQYEDVGIGRCLASLGIYPHKTVNERGQQRFNTENPTTAFRGYKTESDWVTDPIIRGMKGIPHDLISFHKLSEFDIRLFEVLLYKVSIDGESKLQATVEL